MYLHITKVFVTVVCLQLLIVQCVHSAPILTGGNSDVESFPMSALDCRFPTQIRNGLVSTICSNPVPPPVQPEQDVLLLYAGSSKQAVQYSFFIDAQMREALIEEALMSRASTGSPGGPPVPAAGPSRPPAPARQDLPSAHELSDDEGGYVPMRVHRSVAAEPGTEMVLYTAPGAPRSWERPRSQI